MLAPTHSVDLHSRLVESGGLANGTMTTVKFASCLIEYLPRVHFNQQSMDLIVNSYSCGYYGQRRYTND